jgi:pimeloyl-ACP methyl ester carboxylesterase
MCVVGKLTTRTGRELAYEVFGDRAGPAVISLHGTPGSRVGPHPRPSRLYPQGIRLIAYDRPGYGESDRAEGRTVADAAADVEDLADALGIARFAVVGRSGGAPHALACAALLPRRVTRVAALASCAPRDLMGDQWYAGMAQENADWYQMAERGLEAYTAYVAEEMERRRADPESVLPHNHSDLPQQDRPRAMDHGVRSKLVDTFAEALKNGVHGWIDDNLALVNHWGFALPRDSGNVLLWHGMQDTLSPLAHFRFLRERMPEATCRLVEGTAHLSALEAYPKLLSWLIEKPG